jgi:hypothetical protein
MRGNENMTTSKLVNIILSHIRYIDKLELSGEIVKKIDEFKSVRYNEFSLFICPI